MRPLNRQFATLLACFALVTTAAGSAVAQPPAPSPEQLQTSALRIVDFDQ
jgi:hypothetical protein